MCKYLLIRLFSIVFIFSHAVLYAEEKEQYDYYDDYERFVKVVKVIQDKYVDEIDIKDLFHDAYKGMLSGLDSYSQFFDPEDVQDLKAETEGEFDGLGIEVVIRNGMLLVITPMIDSPAMRAGVMAGDIILKIEGRFAENLTFREVINSLRGKPGSKVTLTVLHRDEITPVDVVIERAKIQVKSIKGARIVDNDAKIGYIAITNFQDRTMEDFKAAIKELQKQGMESLVLDLRFNPGGLLNVAIDVSDQFLEKGVIVSTKGRYKSQNIVYKAHRGGLLINHPLVVLLNNGSASASEIVAGAIKDNKRGILLGNRTFGKGSVQSLLPIDDGKSALKLTTARYYTPSGISIHEIGIEPDIHVELSIKEIKALHENLARINNLIGQNSDSGDDENKGEDKQTNEFKDKQLVSAINILKSIRIISN
ncbi:MAG: S41 family peptidase [Candidatus Anammoxibacter sp.]